MSTSDPLLPVPDQGEDAPQTGEERVEEVEDIEELDVVRGAPDGDESEPEIGPTPFRTPAASDRLSEDELQEDELQEDLREE